MREGRSVFRRKKATGSPPDRHRRIRRSQATRIGVSVLVVALLGFLPADALAVANWGFGPSGQSSATITWQPDNGRDVAAVLFTLPVNAKSAKTRQGRRCTIPRGHPHQVRCAISPAAAYGYIDVRSKVRLPCKTPLKFSVRRVGATRFVRQQPIPSGNACS
jgi:hypothetical protein